MSDEKMSVLKTVAVMLSGCTALGLATGFLFGPVAGLIVGGVAASLVFGYPIGMLVYMDVKEVLWRLGKRIEEAKTLTRSKQRKSILSLFKAGEKNRRAKLALYLKGVNTENRREERPLHTAARVGDLDTVKFLLEHGAYIDAPDIYDKQPLHTAAEYGHSDVLKYLIEHGADANAKDGNDDTPLYHALRERHFDCAECLLEHGADVNAKQRYGDTLLYLAAGYGHSDVVKYLIEHGADVNAKQGYGYTPLYRALYKGHFDCAECLLEHGADVNAKNKGGDTLLHTIASYDHSDAVKYLIEHGADVNAKGLFGRTPLDVASEKSANYLKKHGAVSAKSAGKAVEETADIPETKPETKKARAELASKLKEIRKEYGHKAKSVAGKSKIVQDLRKKAER